MAASSVLDGDIDMEKGGMILQSSENQDPSPTPSPSATATAPALVLSNSGKRMDQAGKKKYVKQVTGRHNDTELHLAAQRGDLAAVQQILKDINSQMEGTLSGEEFDAEVAEIRASIVNEVNELGETALFTAADKGHLDVVKELLKYSSRESIAKKNRSGYDPLHIAAIQGHHAIVEVLLDHDATLSHTFGPSNATPLVSAAMRGHTEVVNQLLSKAGNLLDISRQGHVEVIKALLAKDAHLARRVDKKGQTALHMAVKGQSSEVVKLLLDADPAIVMLPDKSCNTALHVATRKKRAEIVELLLSLPDTNANALTRERKTALDIAEEALSHKSRTMFISSSNRPKELTKRAQHFQRAKETPQRRDQQRNQLGNSRGCAVRNCSFCCYIHSAWRRQQRWISGGGGDSIVQDLLHLQRNSLIHFSGVVVVQITLVRGETKAEKRVVEVINKLMWLASMCTSVAFIASSYIVVGRKNEWAAELVTVVGGVIMAGVLGTMTYYVVKSKRTRSMRKKVKSARRSGSNSWHHSDYSNSEVDPIFAI
ncbi:hypothetical protein Bca52824_066737 [Brassica carinata]|uniref:Ankyrin repeat-containing protein n=1 Tax=Brassica carinata TaxID=52824 RepID=A0A8X7QL96_BRACI|nr:hypothetical protein Bca52824_066737 [Brassica carinata]